MRVELLFIRIKKPKRSCINMAATLRHCGLNKYLLYCTGRTNIRTKQIPRKCFHSKHLSPHHTKFGRFSPEQKLTSHRFIKIVGVRFASTDTVPPATPTPEGYILDTPPVPISEGGANLGVGDAFSLPDLTALGEPTLHSLGLAQGGWFSLTTHYETLLQFVHVSLDIPWWVSVVMVSMSIRLMFLPVFIWQRKSLINHSNIFPEEMRLKTLVEDAKMRGNPYETEIYRMDHLKYKEENSYSKVGMFSGPLVQVPIFLTVYSSIRAMVDLPVEGLRSGGWLWFSDLTVADPYYVLPFLTSATMALMMERGVDSQKVSEKPFVMMCVMRIMPWVAFAFMSKFSSALALHWLANNIFSLVQSEVLKIKKVQVMLNMPEMKKKEDQNKDKFLTSAKDKLAAYRAHRQLEDRKEVAHMDFKKAGEGPVPKTYSYDPTKRKIKTAQ